jgi:ribosomal-protein-serine acetyltransferase
MFFINVSEDIKLKLLTYIDCKNFYELTINNSKHLEHFLPRISENKSIEDTQKVINIFLNQLADNNGFRSGIIYENKLVGIVGLKYIDWINKKTEIMYWVDKDSQGKGITTKCVNKLIDIAFNQYGINKVIIKSSISNKASIRIAEKCGFTLEGICKSDELLSDGYTDICYYSLLKDDYLL